MKTRIFQKLRLTLVALTALAVAAGNVLAQDSSTSSTTTTAAQPAATGQTAPQLSYGVPEVLQLSKAKVSDGTIINYIRNSGNNYGLNAAQIIYLRQQGVSSAVINTMLDQQPRTLSGQTAQTAPAAATSQPVNSTTYNTEISTATAQPTVTYVQTIPTSSVYVIPDTQTYRYNAWLYYHSPYYSYYPYYGNYWPASSVSVTYIGHRGWVGYHGGWHGGGHHGGWHHH